MEVKQYPAEVLIAIQELFLVVWTLHTQDITQKKPSVLMRTSLKETNARCPMGVEHFQPQKCRNLSLLTVLD